MKFIYSLLVIFVFLQCAFSAHLQVNAQAAAKTEAQTDNEPTQTEKSEVEEDNETHVSKNEDVQAAGAKNLVESNATYTHKQQSNIFRHFNARINKLNRTLNQQINVNKKQGMYMTGFNNRLNRLTQAVRNISQQTKKIRQIIVRPYQLHKKCVMPRFQRGYKNRNVFTNYKFSLQQYQNARFRSNSIIMKFPVRFPRNQGGCRYVLPGRVIVRFFYGVFNARSRQAMQRALKAKKFVPSKARAVIKAYKGKKVVVHSFYKKTGNAKQLLSLPNITNTNNYYAFVTVTPY